MYLIATTDASCETLAKERSLGYQAAVVLPHLPNLDSTVVAQ